MIGDLVERALARVGVTEERVARWLGGPCGCAQRKAKLNALHAWARRVLRPGRGEEREQDAAWLEEMMVEEPKHR